MIPVDGDYLRAVAPRYSGANGAKQQAIIDAIGGVFRATLAEYEIDSALRIAHFTAQIVHESAGLRTTEEFASGAAYEGREDLGNTEPGDGKRFKGRGLIQLTGRANYAEYGGILRVDLIGDPPAAAEPVLSLRIACEYWKKRRINAPSDDDDLRTCTRLVNGGYNGLEDRAKYLAKAKAELGRITGIALAVNDAPTGRPVLRRGSRGDAVAELQTELRALGYPLTLDGDFGPATEVAVKHYQAAEGLTADGVVGPATWAKLHA